MHVFHEIFVKIVREYKKRVDFHWCLLFQVFPHLCVCKRHFSFRNVCLLNMQYTSFIGSSYTTIWLSVYFHMEMTAKIATEKKRFQVSFFFLYQNERSDQSRYLSLFLAPIDGKSKLHLFFEWGEIILEPFRQPSLVRKRYLLKALYD